ncbi:hypothetical protein QEH52_14925 [Coraliomargarita sp. SDUM461003]|uniref:Knr4/Smi1-like domain-containing protein n=1 Tax=Thalassobacterium maritimum TaxID=3041265 RepID=A0ABU1AXI7_9BACT|nr:hypothetical protein [Coraliomargarita sp. SDUM461003]MDQ8208818.1 hypothetical protein [Coraliomargarita sp. SDUM461003]
MSYDDLSLDETEALAFLQNLMPQGFAGADVMSELAPQGWAQCELVRVFHPTAEQLREEAKAFYEEDRKYREAAGEDDGDFESEWSDVPFPELDEVEIPAECREAQPIDPDRECRDLVGRIVWEVLADDHSVIANDGRRIDLGDYDDASAVLNLFDLGELDFEPEMEDWLDMWDRGRSARFSADMAFIAGRADLVPVYELIFRRMQALDMDWIYQFPKLRLFGFEVPEAPLEAAANFSACASASEECIRDRRGSVRKNWAPALH